MAVKYLLLKAGYMGTVLVMRTASYFLSMPEDNSEDKTVNRRVRLGQM